MGCHFFLQGIFLTQGSNPCLLLGRQIFTTVYLSKPSQCTIKIFASHSKEKAETKLLDYSMNKEKPSLAPGAQDSQSIGFIPLYVLHLFDIHYQVQTMCVGIK